MKLLELALVAIKFINKYLPMVLTAVGSIKELVRVLGLRKYMEAPKKEPPNHSDRHDNRMDKLRNQGKFVGGYPRGIVIHTTDSDDVDSFFESRWLKHGYGAIIIKRCGTVLMPTNYLDKPFVMWHSGKSNWCDPETGESYEGLSRYCIGIEVVGRPDKMNTVKQMEALDKLVNEICNRYNIPLHWVLGHCEVAIPRARRAFCPGKSLTDYVRGKEPKQIRIQEYREYLNELKLVEDKNGNGSEPDEEEPGEGDPADEQDKSKESTLHGIFQ